MTWIVDAPPKGIVGACKYRQQCWEHFTGLITAAGGEVREDTSLKAPCLGAFEFRSNGKLAVYDYSDYLLVHGVNRDYKHWFRFHHSMAYIPHENLHSFPPISFLDWQQYADLSEKLRYHAVGHQILHSQSYEFLKGSKKRRDIEAYERRDFGRRSLLRGFGDRVLCDRLPQARFWEIATRCLVSVHIPGSFRFSLDRGQNQMLGLGICTISPMIITNCLDDRIEPWVHYVPVRDDLSDIVRQVRWCEDHRDECRRIGDNAREFFRARCIPSAVRDYIRSKME